MLTESLRMPVLRVPHFARKHGITSLVLLTVLALNLLAGISLLGVNVTQGRAVATDQRQRGFNAFLADLLRHPRHARRQ